MKATYIIIAATAALFPLGTRAEAADEAITSRFDIGMRAGYAFDSNTILRERMSDNGETGHTAMSWHLRYSFANKKKERTASVYQGLGLSATTFLQPHTVGTPLGVYVFQGAPIVCFSDRFSLDYEWNFGATFGWKKSSRYSEILSNLVVGSSVNAYLNLGFKLNYAFTNNLIIAGGLDMSHYSNGNTSWPNPGVNSIGAAIGLTYIPGGGFGKFNSPFVYDDDFEQGVSYDLMAYGAWRKAYFPAEDGAFTEEGEKSLLPGHFGVAGLTFAPMWDLHPTFRTGVSLDLQWGENTGLTKYHVPDTYGEDAKFYRPPFFRQVSAGVSARAELVMPIFSFNVGIGYGCVGPQETRKLYQTVTLKTYIMKGVYLNVGYRLNEFRSPSNLMLGVGYTFGRK